MPSGNGAKRLQKQERNAKKNEEKPGSQLAARVASIKLVCPACKTPMTHVNLLKPHYEAKHPKLPVPDASTFEQ